MSDIEEMKNKASRLAEEYYSNKGGCTQCVLASLMETLGGISEDVFKVGFGFAGGVMKTGSACGALTGGVMAISAYDGRNYSEFKNSDDRKYRTFELGEKFIKRFEGKYGGVSCKDVQRNNLGDIYDERTYEVFNNFLKEGIHKEYCIDVCGDSARWVVEILNDAGLIDEK